MAKSPFIVKFYDKAYEDKNLIELVKSPVSAISGVSESDAADLKEVFGIETVKDLATNKYVRLAEGINCFSACSGQILDKAFESNEYENLREKPVSAILGISEEDAALLRKSLGIDSIKELAENKYVEIVQTTVAMASMVQARVKEKTVRRKTEKYRPWVGKHFCHIFILAGLLFTIVLGFGPYLLLFNAPTYSVKPGFSGFGIARNDTFVSPTMMVVGLGSDPPELWFQYFFQCAANGTYNFLFAFPFNITSERGTSGNMSFRATSRGSAVWSRYETNNVSFGLQSGEIWGVFSIENTFQSGTRGLYSFLLPFGMGIHPEVLGNLQHELGVGFHTPDASISLQVGLPSYYKITGTFPPVSAGPNRWLTPTNRSIATMEWIFETLQDSVTIHCEDSNEILFYESLPFVSGVFLGIGVPIITTAIYDAVKEWSRFPGKENR